MLVSEDNDGGSGSGSGNDDDDGGGGAAMKKVLRSVISTRSIFFWAFI